MPCAVSCLASVSFPKRDASQRHHPPPRPSAKAARFRRPRPLPTPPSPIGIAPSAAGSRAGGSGFGGGVSARLEPGAPGSRPPGACVCPAPPDPPPQRPGMPSGSGCPPGGAHGAPGLPVHGQPRRATPAWPPRAGAARKRAAPPPGQSQAQRQGQPVPTAPARAWVKAGVGGRGMPSAEGADAGPGGTGWEACRAERVSGDQASRVGCFPRRRAEGGAVPVSLCAHTVGEQAVGRRALLLVTCSVPLCTPVPWFSGDGGGAVAPGLGPSFALRFLARLSVRLPRSAPALTPQPPDLVNLNLASGGAWDLLMVGSLCPLALSGDSWASNVEELPRSVFWTGLPSSHQGPVISLSQVTVAPTKAPAGCLARKIPLWVSLFSQTHILPLLAPDGVL